MSSTGRMREVHLPNVRASLVLGRMDWVRKNHGEAGAARVLGTLAAKSPEYARAIEGAVIPQLWVSFAAPIALIETIDQVFGRGDLGLVKPLAAHAARINMPLLYRIFYKLG